MLLRTGKRLKRASSGGYDEDDGLPLNDEILLVIFARLLNTDDDLVRCAATCRRWRRLVSSEAAFICCSDDTARRFVPVGFFYQDEAYGVRGVPRFVSLASHYFPTASANALFAASEAFAYSRLVTSRKGRLVVELPGASLRLAVCNPMTGHVTVLPELSGKDKPGRYTCALLTADAGHHASSFRLVIVYDRREFTVCRAYSSESGTWDQERKVSGARVSGRTLAQAHAAAVVSRGAVFWRVKDAVLALRLDTLEATLEPLPEDWRRRDGSGCGLLAVWPDGRLCVVEAGIRDVVTVWVLFREESDSDVWGENNKWDDWASWCLALTLQRPSGCYGDLTRVCPRGVCEKSGVVFLAAAGQNWEALYALDLEKKKARLLRGVEDVGASASFHGYEMDRVSYISALGKRDGKINVNITTDVGDMYDF